MIAGTLEIQLLANMARLQADMQKATGLVGSAMGSIQKSVAAAQSALGALGVGIGVAALVSFVKRTIDAQDELFKLAQKVNISVETLAGLQHAADLSGISMESMTKGMKSLGTQMFDAASGSKEAQANFQTLGITFAQTDGSLRNTEQVLIELADTFAKMPDSTEKSALAVKLFGKAGLDMIPMLNAGSDGIRQMIAEGQRLNPVTTESARQAEIFNDNMTRLGKSITAIFIPAINTALPLLVELTKLFLDSDKAADGFANTLENKTTPFLIRLSQELASARDGASSFREVMSNFFSISGAQADKPQESIEQLDQKLVKLRTTLADLQGLNPLAKLFSADDIAIVTEQINRATQGREQLLKLSIQSSAAAEGKIALDAFGPVKPKAPPKITPTANTGGGGGDPDAAFKRLLRTLQDKLLIDKELTEVAKLQRELSRMEAKDLAAITPLRRAELADLAKKVDLRMAEEATDKLMEARRSIQLDAIKDIAQQEQQAKDFALQMNRISDEEYARDKIARAKRVAEEEIKIIEATIQLEIQSRNKAAEGTKPYIEAVGRIEQAEARKNQVLRQFGALSQQVYQQAEQAALAYKSAVEDIETSILGLEGKTAAATARQFDRSREDITKQATTRGDTETLAKLARERQLTVAQAGFNEERQKLSDLNARLSMEEERIQNSQRVGAISDIEALRRTGEARQAQLAEQEAIVASLQKIAAESRNPALILQADQAKAALERLRMESDLLGQKFETIFSGAAADAFTDFINGSKSAKEAMKSFGDSVVNQINRMVAEALSKRFFEAMGLGGKEGGGIGGFFSGLLGGGPSKAPESSGGGIGGILGSIGSLFGFEEGTDFVPRTGLALIHKGEAIIPANENKAGGRTVNVTNVFHISGQTDMRSQTQIAKAAGDGVQRAIARNS